MHNSITFFNRTLLILSIFTGSAITTGSAFASSEHDHDHEPAKNTLAASQTSNENHQHEEADHGHEEEGDSHTGEEHDEGLAEISPQQQTLAGIIVKEIQPASIQQSIYAPAEIVSNDYQSYQASPRTASVVTQRLVTLGDHITVGQPLIKLFSADVAEAQGAYQVASAEWQRIKRLGKATAGEKRYINASTAFQAATSRLLAYGLTTQDIRKLNNNGSTLLGEYTLRAAIAGVVLKDNFNQGEHVEAGTSLVTLTNENTLWVEARVAPELGLEIPKNTIAEVTVSGRTFSAVVTQEAHTIDHKTRTRIVRLTVNNKDHKLHPGLFADVNINLQSNVALTVPDSALMRGDDGDWQVFVEQKPGHFAAVEIEIEKSMGTQHQISGIAAGTKVVTQGAFFVDSELKKSGFDIHNH